MHNCLSSCHEVLVIVWILNFRSHCCLVSVNSARNNPSISVKLKHVPQILADFSPVIEEGRSSLWLRNVLCRLNSNIDGISSEQRWGIYRNASHSKHWVLLVDVLFNLVKTEGLSALEMGSSRRLGRLIFVTGSRLRRSKNFKCFSHFLQLLLY